MKFLKSIIAFLIVAAIAVASFGCAGVNNTPTDTPTDTTTEKPVDKPVEDIKTDLTQGVSASKAVTEPLSKEDTEALAQLYVKLFKNTLDENNKSSLISPLSIITALGMVADGASEETLAQFEDFFGLTTEQLDSVIAYYYLLIKQTDSKVKFDAANSIWVTDSPTFHIKNDYVARVLGAYDPQFYSVDFMNPKTLDAINSWVSDHTDGMIKKIVDELSPDTVMALINAIVFDAKWANPYDSDYQIYDGKFTNYAGEAETVQMMRGEEGSYITLDGAIGFTKAYEGGRFKFVALLPDENVDIYDFIAGMDGAELLDALRSPTWAKVITRMPKFSYDYELEMSKILCELGLDYAFDPFGADFSALATEDTGNIYISRVIHKTHIDVDNEGTKAAAVTAVIMEKATSAGPDLEKPIYITLDRPFVYMIIDSECNLPIFMGVLTEVKGK